jgi:uncharacterized membrane protein YidH (DUF202 family)
MSGIGVSGWGVVMIFQFLFLLGMIVTTNIRLRLPPQLTTRIAQGFCSGGFLIFSFVLFISFISDYSKTHGFDRSRTVGDFMFIMLLHLVFIASAIVAVIHAAAVKIRKDTLSQIALYLTYGAIVCLFAYMIIRPAMVLEQPGLILAILNVTLLTVPIIFLFCSGLIGFICGLAAKTGGSPATTAPAGAGEHSGREANVQERLRKLDDLKNQALVTNEEYNAKRTEILWDL